MDLDMFLARVSCRQTPTRKTKYHTIRLTSRDDHSWYEATLLSKNIFFEVCWHYSMHDVPYSHFINKVIYITVYNIHNIAILIPHKSKLILKTLKTRNWLKIECLFGWIEEKYIYLHYDVISQIVWCM